jgi:hypothetical protein
MWLHQWVTRSSMCLCFGGESESSRSGQRYAIVGGPVAVHGWQTYPAWCGWLTSILRLVGLHCDDLLHTFDQILKIRILCKNSRSSHQHRRSWRFEFPAKTPMKSPTSTIVLEKNLEVIFQLQPACDVIAWSTCMTPSWWTYLDLADEFFHNLNWNIIIFF